MLRTQVVWLHTLSNKLPSKTRSRFVERSREVGNRRELCRADRREVCRDRKTVFPTSSSSYLKAVADQGWSARLFREFQRGMPFAYLAYVDSAAF